jgi:hypothetical protein
MLLQAIRPAQNPQLLWNPGLRPGQLEWQAIRPANSFREGLFLRRIAAGR